MQRANHWNSVYTNKTNTEVSWFELDSANSMELIQGISPLPTNVIDIGGGQSYLVDRLLDLGTPSLTVLDISSVALAKTKIRLGKRADLVRWIEADVTAIKTVGRFDLWHDRAVFHFLTDSQDRSAYVRLAEKSIPVDGHLILGTFALSGPESCSSLPVCRYDESSIAAVFKERFRIVATKQIAHRTPSGNQQDFLFTVFRRFRD